MLRVENVSTGYDNIRVLHQISLTVGEGEIVTLIGSNGVGKTTTLKTISGLLKPTEGKIYFNNRDISQLPPHEIVELGISHVPEGRNVFPRLTVKENLEMGAYTRKDKVEIKKDYARIMELFPQLAQRQKQVAGTLSGGEQQMLAIGRALMSRPRLLLLDEPSMGLAPLVVTSIFEIIKDINRQGTPILLVEQNAQIALRTAHRGYVMETGRIVMSDSARALLQNDRVRKTYLGE
ncbi:MAG: ABC transporter ATP-binding protein [Dethiobacteria bacterium]|nr:ABC transporter ATP-binding protein [Bacillota bacterium]HOP69284.1 ABC transporter ATP-binding protein [Bacillota bacterium]HPT34266.1 ABC transporter ATP-binding protein [Bacillota bacterium]HQD05424.1 ABC transporter ATP-binding protein [Bacillota bacterium]